MKTVVSANPFECCMWELHDRLEGQVSEETCRAEIESFSQHGQLIPVLGRPLQGSRSSCKIELIYGARRLFVARHLNKPLLVELRTVSDREAIVAMDIENRQRKDISPYERGLGYARWLRGGYFRSQEDISRALRVSASQVSRLLKIAHLPTVILQAFENPADICEAWGLDLAASLEDSERRARIVRVARLISRSSRHPPAREVYKQMASAAASGARMHTPAHDEVIKDATGSPLFRIRHHSNSIALLLPMERVSASSLEDIRTSLRRILQAANGQTRESIATGRTTRASAPGLERTGSEGHPIARAN